MADASKPTDIARIRTYAADMARAIRERGETLASIANEERTRPRGVREPREKKSLSPRTLAAIIGAVILSLGSIGLITATVLLQPTQETIETPAGIVFANRSFTVSIEGEASLPETLAVVRGGQNLSLGELLRINVLENGNTLTGPDLARRLRIPDTLAREVIDIMVGVHAFDRNQPFIILKVAAYDRAFSAMLSWERALGQDLGDFFAPVRHTGNAPFLSFNDVVLQNIDARRSQDVWPILYTFPQKDLLIITTNEFTLKEILTRLGSARQ